MVLRLQEASVYGSQAARGLYGSQVARGLCLWFSGCKRPLSVVLRLQEASVYGYQFIQGFLKKDLMSTSEPSSFLHFTGFLVDNF